MLKHAVPLSRRRMNFLKLSSSTRQLIIFLLLVALLWQSRPVVGPDGLVEARFQFFGEYTGKGIPPTAGRIIDIFSMGWNDEAHESILYFEIQDAQVVEV